MISKNSREIKNLEDKNHERNARDFERFLHRLSDSPNASFSDGQLYGPFQVPGPPLFETAAVDLYVGKVTRDIPADAA